MKKISILLTVAVLSFQPQVHAQGWLDSLKSMVGMGEEKPAMPNISDMVSSVTDSLGVTESQATGGLGSLFNYAKDNISSEQFGQLSSALPGVGDLLKAAPDVSEMASEGGLGGLLDKAANYSDSLKSVNDVKKQFEALGLDPEMITQFISKAKEYLDTEEGKQAKELLSKGLGQLLG
ncbi:MAG: hypothetical protein ACI808_002817 [Paraglaciecola sp.]|jgi:hypothetical protein